MENKRDILFAISITAAAVILGASLIISAQIIAQGLAGRNAGGSTQKMLDELVRTINAQNPPGPKPGKGMNRQPCGIKSVEGVTAGTNPVKGSAKAPVLMVEFSDFQCPYSRNFYQQTFPLIEKEYIASGRVKFAYRDFPLDFHARARSAAIAARCAGKQGKYWEMFDKLLLSNSLDEAGLKKCAKEAGLNLKAYEGLLSKEDIRKEMENDIRDAGKFGINGTPAFFINGRFISGARPFSEFKKIIDEELERAGKKK
jgi:protein-disulfide isomerase